ncbi:nucleotidyltransferase domain-containing protein [Calothrix sp. PCC 6303]|uniref:nucleotidyltransferase domain-containing protein n=1 Tax=Calothrix sp. PCC 6303 TaxID=1170562 RepID=UPI0002A00893|nr:nucleotidyltransferase domain-containing protein [Calothrix sp. PCC 6303]AFZ01350.1 DNA polymerase beta domain protein region [Calothrix sp. PCC 6303]
MNQQLPDFIHDVVERLQSIEGIASVALGGSRARGNHTPKSDVDLGIYYQPDNPIDVIALNQLACELDDNHRPNLITPIGEWGKWINGGGWLKIKNIPVDFLYRDVDQVDRVINDCRLGKITIDYQPGHPHGFVSSIYMGEVAISLSLCDSYGVLAALQAKTQPYPIELQKATIDTFAWEISFSLLVGKKSIARGDIAHASGCCFRSIACINQVLFALNHEYLLNEKGAVAMANNFAVCPHNYQQRVESAFALLATKSIAEAVAILEEIELELSQWYGERRLEM